MALQGKEVAKQRCDSLRGAYAFMSQMFLLNRQQLISVDETGTDSHDHIRKYGYALRGITPLCHQLLARGKRGNATVASKIRDSTVNGEIFF